MASAIGALAGIIITLVILGVVWWGIQELMKLVTLAEPFATIVRVLLTIIMVLIVLWVIVVLLGVAGIRVPNPFSSIGGRAAAALSVGAATDLRGVLN